MYTLGIDSSTQSVKALVYDTEAKSVVTTVSVNFGKDLPGFGCPDGFLPNANTLVRQADPLLWVAALDRVLAKLAETFDTIRVTGGASRSKGIRDTIAAVFGANVETLDVPDSAALGGAILADVIKDSNGNELKGPSTDAIDIDKCRRFTVRNVDISVNDDGVVVKGGKGPWADDYVKFPGNGPTTDVLVENCTFRYPTHSALTLGSECPAATNVTMRGCMMDGCGNMINLKMRTDTPQHYANVLVENCRGKCDVFFRVQSWSQYHDAKGRAEAELKSNADGVTLRNNTIEAGRIRNVQPNDKVYEITNLVFENNVFQQVSAGLPLKHDGYVVERWGTGIGKRGTYPPSEASAEGGSMRGGNGERETVSPTRCYNICSRHDRVGGVLSIWYNVGI